VSQFIESQTTRSLLTLRSDGAADVLKAYWKKIGGKPKDEPPTSAKKGPGRKRKADTSASASPAPAKKGRASKAVKTEPKANGTKNPVPPAEEWETAVTEIVTIEESEEKPRDFTVWMLFSDGVKRVYSMRTVRQNCPQKVRGHFYRLPALNTCANDDF